MAVRVRSGRVKRASPYDLYRTCATGDCPPDVIPKVEGNTLADKILKWGSLGVYFGGLGIGTGQARPGLGTYTPLGRGGGGVTPRPGTRPLGTPFGGRPIDTIGSGIGRPGIGRPGTIDTPVDSILPESPAVVTPDSMPTDPGIGGMDVDVELVEEPSIRLIEPHAPDDVAVLDVRPTEHDLSVRTTNSSTVHHNPSFQGGSTLYSEVGETSGVENVLIAGSNIGGEAHENIELQWYTEPRSSTPADTPVGRVRGRANWFSRRYYDQYTAEDIGLLTDPRDYFYEVENPAFEGDSFDVAGPAVSAEPLQVELRDITHVSAARALSGPSGRIGLGRIGFRSTLQTRSGVSIGQPLHFRYSFSTIAGETSLELLPHSFSQEPVDVGFYETAAGDSDFVLVDLDSTESIYSDSHLIDSDTDSLHGILVLYENEAIDTVPVETVDQFPPDLIQRPVTVPDTGLWPSSKGEPPAVIAEDDIPGIIILTDSDAGFFWNTFLHPSLLSKKKGKKTF
ncbi:L2 [Cervus papillomavirus 2]|uniref:Minor capsid protein L2 n=1 Tax=Cervus elaphus papillomavirus 1 TaxID=1163699 RepID=A0A182BAF1_9PAPI|nr:L2 [Cervus papillomavirus 2]ALX18689.1 L2 [Cervus papillomavirus 2]